MFKPNKCSECPCYWYAEGYDDSDEGCAIRPGSDQFYYETCYWPLWYRKYRIRKHDREMEEWYKQDEGEE